MPIVYKVYIFYSYSMCFLPFLISASFITFSASHLVAAAASYETVLTVLEISTYLYTIKSLLLSIKL